MVSCPVAACGTDGTQMFETGLRTITCSMSTVSQIVKIVHDLLDGRPISSLELLGNCVSWQSREVKGMFVDG